jgi:hypothetical protein
MTLLRYGEMRKTGFAPAFDLIVYGFSAGEADRIVKSLGNPHFERGELLRRLRSLERVRKLPDGFTTCLSKDEVMRLVKSIPDILIERSRRVPSIRAHPMTDDDRMEMGEKARNLITSVNLMSDRMRLHRINGKEWQDNPGRLLQRDVGIDFC